MIKGDAKYKCPKCGITGVSQKKKDIFPLCHKCNYKVKMKEIK